MTAERWQQLERIFTEARQLPADARADFVVRACGADQPLREEAVCLLTADEAASQFMAKPALERLAQSVATDGWILRPGERIGAYSILRRLGVGGAGEVWRARDERLGRDVAIKVLLPHLSSDPQRMHGFADEARMASALNHANILTVYDVGEHRGIPFLVAECLEGQSLRRHRRVHGAGTDHERGRRWARRSLCSWSDVVRAAYAAPPVSASQCVRNASRGPDRRSARGVVSERTRPGDAGAYRDAPDREDSGRPLPVRARRHLGVGAGGDRFRSFSPIGGAAPQPRTLVALAAGRMDRCVRPGCTGARCRLAALLRSAS